MLRRKQQVACEAAIFFVFFVFALCRVVKRQAEVDQVVDTFRNFCPPTDVLRLQVPVHKALLVQTAQSLQNLQRYLVSVVDSEPMFRLLIFEFVQILA